MEVCELTYVFTAPRLLCYGAHLLVFEIAGIIRDESRPVIVLVPRGKVHEGLRGGEARRACRDLSLYIVECPVGR